MKTEAPEGAVVPQNNSVNPEQAEDEEEEEMNLIKVLQIAFLAQQQLFEMLVANHWDKDRK